MTDSDLPPFKSRVGKGGLIRMPPNGELRRFTIVGEICRKQTDNPKKIFCLQRLEFEETDRIELRICYYIIGKKPRAKGKWTFGQYAPLLPPQDLQSVVQEAQKRGWI